MRVKTLLVVAALGALCAVSAQAMPSNPTPTLPGGRGRLAAMPSNPTPTLPGGRGRLAAMPSNPTPTLPGGRGR